MKFFLFLVFQVSLIDAKILKFDQDIQKKMETDDQIAKIQSLLNKLHEMNDQEARTLYIQQYNDQMKEYEKQLNNKSNRKLMMSAIKGAAGGGGGGGGKGAEPTIINIPVPKITETELEVVHVFPQGYPYGGNGYPMGGGYGGGGFTPDLIPSYSVTSNVNGNESTSNFWGFNPSRNLQQKNKQQLCIQLYFHFLLCFAYFPDFNFAS